MHYCNRLIIIIALILPASIFAQDITGLWRGYMYNDTTQKNYKYEIAISEDNGKLSGYSHTYFIIDDKEYHGVKKIKIHRQDDKIVVEDVELIANNYPIAPPKGVHQLTMFSLEIRDTVMILAGMFTTNRTRKYHPVTGYVHIERKRDYHQSALIPHLEELGLAQNLSFVRNDNPEELSKGTKATMAKLAIDPKKADKATIKSNETKPVIIAPVTKSPKLIIPPAAEVNNRKIETIQSVYFKSDSLELTLFDNGEVDGDTVSVLMNGMVIMPKVGLSTRAVRKTIYITKEMPDSILLIMYAENLGSIPPNTGLLVVHDGEDIYEIRFSGDMQKSPAIVFRRKGSRQ